MNTLATVTLFCVALSPLSSGYAQTLQGGSAEAGARLDQRVEHFELRDESFLEGLAKLSMAPVTGLHLGVEEAGRERLSDPRDRSVRFSLVLEHKQVREILDALCKFDARYTWSTDESSINVYPKESTNEPSNLLNLQLEKIPLRDISDAEQALTPLAKQLPKEQIGYVQIGGDNTYAKPWSITFEHLTVRQFINRIAEHMGPQTSWIWQGGKDSKMFTFLKGGFRVPR